MNDVIKRAVAPFIADDKLVGAVTYVAIDGEVVHHMAHGRLSRATGRPLPGDAIFHIFSMTKPVTTVALLRLVDTGQVGLDDSVAAYLPDFAAPQVLALRADGSTALVPAPSPPTVSDLLRHTAGFDYRVWETPVGALYRRHGVWDIGYSLAKVVANLAALPLAYAPGTSWQYSCATDVAARLVEVVGGQPFERFLAAEILGPLGMVDTSFAVPPEKTQRVAALYGAGDWAQPEMTGRQLALHAAAGEHRRIDPPEPPVVRGSTGLWSTAVDYGRFAQMLLNGGVLDTCRLLRASTVAQMIRPQLPPAAQHQFADTLAQPGYSFGYGVRVVTDPAATGAPAAGAFGWWGAGNASFWVDPARGLTAVQLSHYVPANWFPLPEAFQRAVYAAL